MTKTRSAARPSTVPCKTSLLNLPEDVLDLILSKLSIKDRLEKAQLTCRALRGVLTRPRLGSYGVVHVHPPQPAAPLNSIQKYEDLSEWLRYRVQGITQLILQVDRHNESFFVSHLVFWLMGRYQKLLFGIHIQMQVPSRINDCLFTPVIMPSLVSQLVSLQVCSDASIWPGLFQLQALTRLCLSVADTLRGRQVDLASLPTGLQLPDLTHLELRNCNAALSPLLDGADLPSLETLLLSKCKVPGGIALSGISAVSSMKGLAIDACDFQDEQEHVSLRHLQRLDIGHRDVPTWQTAVQGSDYLTELTVMDYRGDARDLLQTVTKLPALMYIRVPMPELTPNILFHLGRIQGIIEDREGTCSLLQFAF